MEINDTLDVGADAPTRERVARTILERGPSSASVLAEHGFTAKEHWTTGTVVITEFVRR